MAKGYWVTAYRSVKDPARLVEYAKLATPALEAGGARFLARGLPAKVFEAGVSQRTVLIEFPSVEAAARTYNGPAYQNALKALGKGAEREVRILEGLE
jgi:uncharacterized protein (DUF1330 family)